MRHVYFSCTGNVVEEVSLLTSPFPGLLIKSEHEACNESWEVDHVEWTDSMMLGELSIDLAPVFV